LGQLDAQPTPALENAIAEAITLLVGPARSAGNPNLTILRFSAAIADVRVRGEVDDLIEKAKASAAFAIDWRNHHIAHRDLDLALGRRMKVLEEAAREKVEGALSALRAVVNHIEHVDCGASTLYGPSPGDAKELLHVIRDGLLRQQDRRARWHKGELHDDDIAPLEKI